MAVGRVVTSWGSKEGGVSSALPLQEAGPIPSAQQIFGRRGTAREALAEMAARGWLLVGEAGRGPT